MKKTLLSLLLVLFAIAFSGCDANAYPEVTPEEATASLAYASSAYTSGAMLAMGGSAEGISYTASGTGFIIEFDAYDISATADPYTSISGTISADSDTISYDLTFTGGPVITLYLVINNSGAAVFEVNGHDMLDDVTITITM